MDVFPSKRAVVNSLVPSDFSVTHCNVTSSAETLTVPAYGMVAVITNKSYGFVEIQLLENKSGTAVTGFNTGAGDHISLIYTRTSTIDLSTTAIAVLGYDNYVTMVDDVINSDTSASLMIIPYAVADFDTIYEKYHS